MPIDLRKIDGQIRKLQDIRRVLSDPESAKLLEEALVKRRRSRVQLVQFHPNGHMPPSRAVWKCIVGIPGRFTVPDVAKLVREGGVQVENSTVSRIMSALVRQNRIRVVERGSGRRPNVCERVPLQ